MLFWEAGLDFAEGEFKNYLMILFSFLWHQSDVCLDRFFNIFFQANMIS